jgi:AraC-like DNA-binding protein
LRDKHGAISRQTNSATAHRRRRNGPDAGTIVLGPFLLSLGLRLGLRSNLPAAGPAIDDAGRCPRPPAVYEEKTKTMNSTPIAGAAWMTKKAATCIAIDEARAETPFSATLASNTLRAAVEKEVEKLLPHGKAQKRTVAKALAMSTRTLTRRLAVQETTYEEVVDQLRCSLALQHLKDPGMSLSQIAWQLGYEQSPSFHHAFRRWTGRSPSEVRKRKWLPAAA